MNTGIIVRTFPGIDKMFGKAKVEYTKELYKKYPCAYEFDIIPENFMEVVKKYPTRKLFNEI